MRNLLLAGDIGGTKTLVGLFERADGRLRPIAVRTFDTLEHDDLPAMIRVFFRDADTPSEQGTTACFGVAGPVLDRRAELTNVPWRVDARLVEEAFGIRSVRLLNDLQAMAYGVPVLNGPEVYVLQAGHAIAGGNIAIIAAGTGLGEG